MFAHALASNLCSEATNISFFIFRVLIVVAEVNSTAVSIKIFEEFYRTSHLDDLLTLQTLLILLLWRLPACVNQSPTSTNLLDTLLAVSSQKLHPLLIFYLLYKLRHTIFQRIPSPLQLRVFL
mgnify:CR=1 FL=1